MPHYLSENEKAVLNILKEMYNNRKTNPLVSVDLKLELSNQKDAVTPLQENGYIEIDKSDLGSDLELGSITLKDKFFSYFNI